MEKTKNIWMDGELVPWDDAQIHVLSYGLLYGLGVFEGIRCYETERGPAVFRLRDHLLRLQRSAKVYLLTVPYPVDVLVEAVSDLIRANGVDDCYIRPVVCLGAGPTPLAAPTHTSISSWPWEPHLGADSVEQGVKVRVSSFRRIGANAIPPAAKATGQYLNSALANIEALLGGQQEAILLNDGGYVTDGTAENVFVVRDDVVVTPPTSVGALDGITRASVCTLAEHLGYRVRHENLVRTDLYLADEVFLTGTAADVVPVVEVDHRQVGDGSPGRVTQRLQSAFTDAATNPDGPFSDWLHLVNG
jgi:branched-chain amino acid aminotransferase